LGRRLGLSLKEGGRVNIGDLRILCDRISLIMAQSLGLTQGPESDLELMITAHPLRRLRQLFGLTFSGGVADCIYGPPLDDPFVYGDIGPILGQAVVRCPAFGEVNILTPKETIRATVVGAGSNSLELSGSTVTVSHPESLPLKNIPILKLTEGDEADDFLYFASRLAEKALWFKEENRDAYQTVAVAFKGIANPAFAEVKRLARKIADGLAAYLRTNDLLIVVLDRDMAKSLGNALMNALPGIKIICLDNVKVENGDYIDIGLPLANGRVLPIVVKTLVFGR
jgi:ethanolamine utilization protein EutA